MAYGRRRYYKKRRRSSPPSAIAQITKPLRMPFQWMGIKSPILQTLLATPLVLATMSRFAPDIYDRVTEFPELINDFIDDRIGGI